MNARRLAVVLTLAASAAALLALPGQAAGTQASQRYIVVLKDSVGHASAVATSHRSRFRANVHDVYEHALKGYVATLTPGQAAALSSDARVAFVEADQPVTTLVTQTGATWGLDRIDQRTRPFSGTFTYTLTGAGVTAYVIDTGIRFSHTEFGGRAVTGFDAIDGGSADDCNGHGTHVAGTIGGSTYGVAKGVTGACWQWKGP